VLCFSERKFSGNRKVIGLTDALTLEDDLPGLTELSPVKFGVLCDTPGGTLHLHLIQSAFCQIRYECLQS
jgi:hypothetical protein